MPWTKKGIQSESGHRERIELAYLGKCLRQTIIDLCLHSITYLRWKQITVVQLPVGVMICFSVKGRWPRPCSTTWNID